MLEQKPEAKIDLGDEFANVKAEITALLTELQKSIIATNQFKEKFGNDREKQAELIKMKQANADKLSQAKDLWVKLSEFDQNPTKKMRRNTTEDDVQARKDLVVLLQAKIEDLEAEAQGREPAAHKKDIARRALEDRQRIRKQREQAAAELQKKGRGGKDIELSAGGGQEGSSEEKAFLQEVAVKDAQIETKLEELLVGIKELRPLAEDIGHEFETQAIIVAKLEEKTDKNIVRLRVANDKIEDILRKSKGLSLWCPRIILLTLLIALAGYCYSLIKNS